MSDRAQRSGTPGGDPPASPRGEVTAPRHRDRDPGPPRAHDLRPVAGRWLDPQTALTVEGVAPRSTSYVSSRLVLSAGQDRDTVLGRLREVAEPLGWVVDLDED